MNRLGSVGLALSLTVTLFGCPTRPGANPDGADDTDSGTGGGAGGVGGSGGGNAKDGQSCFVPGDCASGLCSPFYVDVDGDGYGTGQAMGFCGTTAPVGYSAQSGDCCDNATNLALAKLIHPGADFQTASAGGVCGITWDYDCSGMVETDPQVSACGGTYPACTTVMSDSDPSACGTANNQGCSCSGRGDGTTGACQLSCVGHPDVPIRCK